MTIEEKTGNINDIIKMLNRVNETFSYEIYIPSLKKSLMFREINASQQKRLVKSIIDSPIYHTEFIFAIRQIIKENCVENDINTDNLTIFDKLIISLMMRSISIGNEVEISLKCSKCNKKHTKTIFLKDLINESLKKEIENNKIISDDENKYILHCSIPTIYNEYQLENELRKNVDILEIKKDQNEARKTMGDIFISEITKHINKIEIKVDENTVNEIDLMKLNYKQRMQIIEQLPARLLKKVVKYIDEINKIINEILIVKTSCTCDENVTIEERMDLSPNFFIVS